MKQNKLLYLIGETDDDLILDAAPNREKKNKNKWVKPLAFAASFVFLVSAALGGYAITAEAAEYREAVEFFEKRANEQGYLQLLERLLHKASRRQERYILSFRISERFRASIL